MTPRKDIWPDSEHGVAELFVRMDRLERRRIRFRESDPVRRALIVDLAGEKFWRRSHDSCPPERPRAWFHTVVEHLLKSDEIPTTRHHRLQEFMVIDRGEMVIDRGEFVTLIELGAAQSRRTTRADSRKRWLVSHLRRLLEDARLRTVVLALLQHSSLRAASRSLAMPPSNFRRALERARKKIIQRLEQLEKGAAGTP